MRRRRAPLAAWTVLLPVFLIWAGIGAAASPGVTADAAIRTALTRGSLRDPVTWDIDRWRNGVAAFYEKRRFEPLWFARGARTRSAVGLLAELARAEDRGLSAADYDAAALESRSARPEALSIEELASLDVALTVVAARFVTDLHAGRIRPAEVGHELDEPSAPFDAWGAVDRVASPRDVAATLDALEPALHHYALLKTALKRYRGLAAAHPDLTRLPALPKGKVAAGEAYSGASRLRRLLAAQGDLDGRHSASADLPLLDEALVDGLRRFQLRHGLDGDGVLGKNTFAALTVPFDQRVSQIVLSMERIRWLPTFDSPPIIVNIPQFRLFAFRTVHDRADDILQMDVIVGSSFKGRRTPVFSATLRTIVLQPYWDVPRSILVNELLPHAQRDAGWLTRNDYEIVRGESDASPVLAATPQNVALLAEGKARVRQKPGRSNALGRVKFLFPNRHNVYLHDTPVRELFQRSRRAFSHGCIRVADPMGLLAHLMRDEPGWSDERRDEALARATPTRIPVSHPVRVFILYGTALAKEDGTVQFFEDIYGHDEPLTRKLSSRRR